MKTMKTNGSMPETRDLVASLTLPPASDIRARCSGFQGTVNKL